MAEPLAAGVFSNRESLNAVDRPAQEQVEQWELDETTRDASGQRPQAKGRPGLSSEEARHPWAENKVRILRQRRNWSLKEFSEVSGVPLNTIWRLEKGGSPVLGNAMRIAEAFQLTIYEVWNVSRPLMITRAEPAKEKRNNLRILRRERGWTLNELARRSRVPKSTVAQLEGGRDPRLQNAIRIAAAFGLSVYDIWSIPGE
jgi:transcriptional regulator with XRE-family HTH domain